VVLLAVLIVFALAVLAGAVGLFVTTLHWLLWLALVLFIAGLSFGLAKRAFTRGYRRTRRNTGPTG
jgi:membrane protein implicated in regulation of membrane protease activity